MTTDIVGGANYRQYSLNLIRHYYVLSYAATLKSRMKMNRVIHTSKTRGPINSMEDP
jgi:hypothetical protein